MEIGTFKASADDDVINWNVTDSVYSAAILCSWHMLVRVKTNANRTLKINSRQSSSHPTHETLSFYVLVIKLLEEALEDVTHFYNLSSASKTFKLQVLSVKFDFK